LIASQHAGIYDHQHRRSINVMIYRNWRVTCTCHKVADVRASLLIVTSARALNDGALDPLDFELAKARLGSAQRLRSWSRRISAPVYSLALRMLGTRDLAEDLTRTFFMRLTAI